MKKSSCLFAALVAVGLFSSSAQCDWKLKSAVSDYKITVVGAAESRLTPDQLPSNIGDDFKKALADKARFSTEELTRLRNDFAVIFVPGFISETIIDLDKLNPGIPLGGYFNDQIGSLKNDHGVDASLFRTESEASVAENAERIAQALRKSDRRVILIGHSKGGLEILDALVHYPDIRPKVAGWIALQSPFFGSPLADLAYENKVLRLPSDLILQLLGGSDHCLHDMETKTRRRYFERYKGEIRKLLSEIPHISAVTWIDEDLPVNPLKAALERLKKGEIFDKKTYTFYKATRDLMLHGDDGEHSDGMVPRTSAVLPGAKYAAIEGPDHGITIGEYGFSVLNREDRIKMIQALLKLLLKDIGEMKPHP